MTALSIRARVREELTSEIKAAARRQLATEGANLSLRAVARELGMVSSALYRYFPSRDDLLTALIIDCYNELGEAAEQAAAAQEKPLDQWLAFGHGVRDWALAHPADYLLIYGTPVPGYKAPEETVGPASRTTNTILRMLTTRHFETDGQGAHPAARQHRGAAKGELQGREDAPMPSSLAEELQAAMDDIGAKIPMPLLARGLTAWVQLFGIINFELNGRFNHFIDDNRREFFDHQMRVMARHVGL